MLWSDNEPRKPHKYVLPIVVIIGLGLFLLVMVSQ